MENNDELGMELERIAQQQRRQYEEVYKIRSRKAAKDIKAQLENTFPDLPVTVNVSARTILAHTTEVTIGEMSYTIRHYKVGAVFRRLFEMNEFSVVSDEEDFTLTLTAEFAKNRSLIADYLGPMDANRLREIAKAIAEDSFNFDGEI